MTRFSCKKIFVFLSIVLFLSAAVFFAVKLFRYISKGYDLKGVTYLIEDSGTKIKNCYNGDFVIKESVGAGVVIFENCQDISVKVESSAYLLLDSLTSVNVLHVQSNARIDSLESFLLEQNNSITDKTSIETKANPKVSLLEIENGFSPVIKNVDYTMKGRVAGSKKTDSVKKPLFITQDTSYEGVGVRFKITNIPADAVALYVVLVQDGVEKNIDWFSANSDRNRFYSGIYDYRYLDAGKEYTFRFYYQDEKSNVVNKFQVNGTPEKGNELKFDSSRSKLNINEKTGVLTWELPPEASMPEGSEIVYDMISMGQGNSWNFIGQLARKPARFNPVNIYEDIKLSNPENIHENKVYFTVYFRYETYRWPILDTEQFNVHYKVK